MGVASRNAVVAPRPAPDLRSDAATGMTLHEQRGSGMPNRAALTTGQNPPPPRWRATSRAGISTDSSPAMAKPKSRYGDIRHRTAQNSAAIRIRVSTVNVPPIEELTTFGRSS